MESHILKKLKVKIPSSTSLFSQAVPFQQRRSSLRFVQRLCREFRGSLCQVRSSPRRKNRRRRIVLVNNTASRQQNQLERRSHGERCRRTSPYKALFSLRRGEKRVLYSSSCDRGISWVRRAYFHEGRRYPPMISSFLLFSRILRRTEPRTPRHDFFVWRTRVFFAPCGFGRFSF